MDDVCDVYLDPDISRNPPASSTVRGSNGRYQKFIQKLETTNPLAAEIERAMNGFFGKVNDIVLKAIEDRGEDAEAIREEARGLVKLGLVARFGNPTQSLATNFTKDANAWNTFFSERAKTRLDIAGTPSLVPISNLDVQGSFGTASTEASEEWRAMGQERSE